MSLNQILPTRVRGGVAALLIAAGFWSLAARAEDAKPLPPIDRAERLTFDEKTGTWIRTAPPTPGTPDGDLDVIRQLMAREDYKNGLKAVNDWIKKYGTEQPRYAEALHLRASAELATGDYRAAHDDYQKLLSEHGGSAHSEDALQSEFRIAEQYLAGKRRKAWKGLLRVKDREAGVKILDEMVANYPETPLAELAQRAKADYYYSRGEFELAEDEYATFAKNYPRSRFHPYALLQSARAALASFPGVKFDDVGLVEAQERYTQFMQSYPAPAKAEDVPVILEEISARRAEKTLEIGKFYQKTKKTNAASYYYRETVRRWPDTAAASEARGRLAAMGQPVEIEPEAVSQAGLPSERGG